MLRDRVARNIKRLRTARGLTQVALGEKAGVDARNLSKIELEERGLNLDTLESLARGLGVPPHQLLMPEKESRDPEALSTTISSLHQQVEMLAGGLARAEAELATSRTVLDATRSMLRKLEKQLLEAEKPS